MEILHESIVAPGNGIALVVNKGQVFRVTMVEGKQVADIVFFNAHNYKESFHCSESVTLNQYEGVGGAWSLKKLYSKPPYENVMFTVLEDKVGVHAAFLSGRCTRRIYEMRQNEPAHANCQDILAEAIMPFGLAADDVPDVFNCFMDIKLDSEGHIVIAPPTGDKGDYIDLRAEMDCLVAASVCPSDKVPTNDFQPKPLKFTIYEL